MSSGFSPDLGCLCDFVFNTQHSNILQNVRMFLFKDMRINIKAKPNSHEEKVVKISGTEFIVSVKEPPVHGLANKAIIKALADYFNVAQVRVRIVSGYTSRQKAVEIVCA